MTALAPPRGRRGATRKDIAGGAAPGPRKARRGAIHAPKQQSRASCAAKRREGAQGVLRVAETEAATVGGGLSSPLVPHSLGRLRGPSSRPGIVRRPILGRCARFRPPGEYRPAVLAPRRQDAGALSMDAPPAPLPGE
jgi:hypothetical protein